jgi:hypothetical protein
MKTRNLIAMALTAIVFCSCIPSVNPFYTEKDVVFDAHLVGEWRTRETKDEPQSWIFEKSATNNFCKLTVTESNGKEGKFEACLFKLKENYFLDLVPSDCEYATNQADLVGFAMFPGHLLARVPQIEPELKLAFCNFDWLTKYLEKNPKALAHHTDKERGIVLTADTQELQKFVLKHLGTNELFNEPGELVRQTNAVANQTNQ